VGTNMKIYALRHKETKQVAGFEIDTSCGGWLDILCELYLGDGSDNVWTTTEIDVAIAAANNSSKRRDSSFRRPVNGYAGELEVVELGIINDNPIKGVEDGKSGN
jgi:hypothetical protein